MIFITCLQSLRLTPPLRAAETKFASQGKFHLAALSAKRNWNDNTDVGDFDRVDFDRGNFSFSPVNMGIYKLAQI